MSPLRRICLALSSSLFRLLLFLEATLIATVMLFGTSAHIKETLRSQNVYQSIVPAILDANIATNRTESSIPLTDQNVRDIALDSFPAPLLQKHAETVIDAAYLWLDGKSPKITFTVDFTPSKERLGERLSQYAFTTMEQLAVCQIQPTEIDPFTATCRPKNYDFVTAQSELERAIVVSDAFLPDPSIDETHLPKLANTPIDQKFSYGPQLFTWIKRSPWIIGSLTLIFAGLSIALQRSKRLGLRQLGYGTAWGGLFLIVSPLIFGFLVPNLTKNIQASISGGGTQAIIDNVLASLTRDFDTLLINIGLQLLAAGVVIIGIERISRPTTRYAEVGEKSGVMSGLGPKRKDGKYRLTADKVPLQSSDQAVTKTTSKKSSSKYRSIPKKEL